MNDFKVGDRFSVEGVVTALADREGDYRALFDGHETDGYVIGAEMAHAKLIQPNPRYDWSNIPPEYDWAATDRGGAVYAYKNKPFCKDHVNFWISKNSGDMFRLYAGHQITEDWRDSLEQRPDVAPEHDIEAHTHNAPCKGKNCGSTTGMNHSPECEAEHIAAITGVHVEEKVLDLSKPMQFKYYPDRKIKAVYGPTSINTYMVEEEKGVINMYIGEALENIPEPKITTSDVLSLWKFHAGARAFMWGNDVGSATRISSQVRVSYTEGEGWSIEEVK